MLVKPVPQQAIRLFAERFGEAPRVVTSAPICIPVLGDLNGPDGAPILVIGGARRAGVAVGPGPGVGSLEVAWNSSATLRVGLGGPAEPGWPGALASVIRELTGLGGALGGARLAIVSDMTVPAAVAVAATKALAALGRLKATGRQVAGAAFRAGRTHPGETAGIATHAAIALARREQAVLVEGITADVHFAPLGDALLLVETGAEPGADALERERRAECEAAVARLKLELPELVWLATWPTAWLTRLKKSLPEPLRSRALHVVGETARARFGAELLAAGNRKRFGQLLYESHESRRRLFGVSLPRVDRVVAAAKRAGAMGARGVGMNGEVLVFVGKRGVASGKRVRAALTAALDREVEISEIVPAAGVRLENRKG